MDGVQASRLGSGHRSRRTTPVRSSETMLRKITSHQLRIGMHIHEVPGSWLSHPFWRASFKLADGKQLAQLRAAVSHVVIDTSKGLDVAAAEEQTTFLDDVEVNDVVSDDATDIEVHRAEALQLAGVAPISPPKPASFQDEVLRASRIVAQSRTAMQSMFQDVRLGKAVDAEHCLPLVDDITQSVSRNPAPSSAWPA